MCVCALYIHIYNIKNHIYLYIIRYNIINIQILHTDVNKNVSIYISNLMLALLSDIKKCSKQKPIIFISIASVKICCKYNYIFLQHIYYKHKYINIIMTTIIITILIIAITDHRSQYSFEFMK